MRRLRALGRFSLKPNHTVVIPNVARNQFKFTASKRLELRFESFNALNHPNFAGYQNVFSTAPGSQFNTCTSTATNARQMQLSARFVS